MFALGELFAAIGVRPRRPDKAARIAAAVSATVEAMEARQMLSSYSITADAPQVTEGHPASITLHAQTDDPDDVSPVDFTVNWGDGNTQDVPVDVSSDNGGVATKTINHTYADEEGATEHVTATAEESGCVNGEWVDTIYNAGSADISIQDAALHQQGDDPQFIFAPGNEVTAEVGDFTDDDPGADSGDYTAVIQWGDGQTSAGTIAPKVGGGFGVTGTHTYDANLAVDIENVTTTVTDHSQSVSLLATGKAIRTKQVSPTGAVSVSVSGTKGPNSRDVVVEVTQGGVPLPSVSVTGTITGQSGGTAQILGQGTESGEKDEITDQQGKATFTVIAKSGSGTAKLHLVCNINGQKVATDINITILP